MTDDEVEIQMFLPRSDLGGRRCDVSGGLHFDENFSGQVLMGYPVGVVERFFIFHQ